MSVITTSGILLAGNPTASAGHESVLSMAITQVTLLDGSVTLSTIPIAVSTGPAAVTSHPTTEVFVTKTTPGPTQPAETQQPTGPPLSTLLPAIVAPVVFLLILASVILFTCLHFRNKKRERLASYDDHGVPAETAPLKHKTSQSFTLPSPLSENERLKEGQLGVFEHRRSLDRDRTRSNGDIVALYERPTNGRDYDPEKYSAPRPPPPIVKPMAAVPPPQTRPPPQQRPPRQQRPPQQRPPPPQQKPYPSAQRQIRPPPPLPPPKPKPTEAAPSWPLPADGPLPSPELMHSTKTSQSSKSKPSSLTSDDLHSFQFQLPPLTSTEPFSMREALRPDSDTYDLSTSAATSAPTVPPLHHAKTSQSSNPFSTYSGRKRESDAISELSYQDRRSRVRDTDSMSDVSAMSRD